MAEFVSGSVNGLAFWDSKSLTEKRRAQPFGPSDCHVASLSWGASNSRLAVVPKWGERVALADLQEGTLDWSLLQHKDGVSFTCGCLLHSSQYLLTGGADSLMHIWDTKTGDIVKTFMGHTAPVTCVARSSNDHVIVSGSHSGSLLLHAVGTQQATSLTGEDSPMPPLNRLRFSVQEKSHVGTVCEDGSVSLWSVESQRLLTQFKPSHTSSATDVCFSPSNNMLMVSVGMDAKIRCWDIQQRKSVTVISAPGPLTSVAVLRDGTTLIGGGTNGKLYVYELRSLKTPRQLIEAHQSAITCISEQTSRSSGRRSSVRSSHGSRGPSSPAKSTQRSSAKQTDTSEATPTATPTAEASTSAHKHVPPSREKSHGRELGTRSHKPNSRVDVTDGSSQSLPSSVPVTRAAPPARRQHDPKPLPEATMPPFSQAGRSDLLHTKATYPSVSHSQTGELGSTITPFITHQHGAPWGVPGLNMTAQTPMTRGPLPERGWKESAVLATPANMPKDTSGIFSPLESNLTTPLTTPLPGSKTTAAVPPTVRSSDHREKKQGGTTGSHSHSTVSVQGRMGSGPGGIFSPLDDAMVAPPGWREAGAGGSTASPQLKPAGEAYVHPTTSQPLHEQRPPSRDLSRPGSHGSTITTFPPHPPHLPPTQPPLADQRHVPVPEEQALEPTAGPEGRKHAIGSSDSSSTVQGDTAAPPKLLPRATPTKTSEDPSAPRQGGAIQMQYIENLLKDSHEELRYALHRDIRALSLDMFRQFFIQQVCSEPVKYGLVSRLSPPLPHTVFPALHVQESSNVLARWREPSSHDQTSARRLSRGLVTRLERAWEQVVLHVGGAQQFATALGLLNEKVERLSEENLRLQEQLHQCMPKH